MQNINKNCTCPSTDCKRHGDCTACEAFHKTKGTITKCRRTTANQTKNRESGTNDNTHSR